MYFTHEIDGRLYCGWYKPLSGKRVEVHFRAFTMVVPLGNHTVLERANQVLVSIVRSWPPEKEYPQAAPQSGAEDRGDDEC